ncbi:MgtC/SapB family protein [Aquihabitans sp. McL0605]|uniref:MgtC/SapB family protein n=1 Tax=Aquihabitans sp. McL0605 TaxID=3415671 RepID=UPI003CF5653F
MVTMAAELGPHLLAVHGIARADLTFRMLAALGLTYLIGFERELRGAAAGDRTFALIGLGSAVIGFLALNNAPNALAGVVTGIGFLGAGVIIHGGVRPDESMIRGVTTAATIYLAAAVGAACGQGELYLATITTAGALFMLEVRHGKVLRWLDGRRWAHRFVAPNDPDLPDDETTQSNDDPDSH